MLPSEENLEGQKNQQISEKSLHLIRLNTKKISSFPLICWATYKIN